jgi:drug/metabolite transporter (DMT)-like permease
VLRHEFQPGKLVAGVFLAVAGAVYAGDAGGLWQTPWFAMIPLVTGGLCLAGAVAVANRAIRRRQGAGRTSTADSRPDISG